MGSICEESKKQCVCSDDLPASNQYNLCGARKFFFLYKIQKQR